MKLTWLILTGLFISGCGVQKVMPVLKGGYQLDKVEQAEIDLRQSELINELIAGQEYILTENKEGAMLNQQRLKLLSESQLSDAEKRAKLESESLDEINSSSTNFMSGFMKLVTGDSVGGVLMIIMSALGIGYGERQRRKGKRLREKINLVAGMDGEQGVKYLEMDPDLK